MVKKPTIFTVSRLNQAARQLLEQGLGTVWLKAEISNLAFPVSGHWYFSLKDPTAQVRCAMFRGVAINTGFIPKEGDQVLVKARISLYEARGDYQLIIESLAPSGEGALQQAFELLKHKLASEGLFMLERKRGLPTLPQCVGVVTSSSGAAIYDILTVLNRRFPALPIIIYPTSVQGSAAPTELVAAVQLANQHAYCDVLIVARGGGSLEDLAPFNTEIVARALFASAIPIVSAIGHEVDVTIADLVADKRAATPSAAAELVSPHKTDYLRALEDKRRRLLTSLKKQLTHWQNECTWLYKSLSSPQHKLQEKAQTLDFLSLQLAKNMFAYWHKQQQRYTLLNSTMQAYSPQMTLKRGFAIITKNSQVISSVTQVAVGDKLMLSVEDGDINCEVINS